MFELPVQTARQQWIEFSAKEFFADCPVASTALLRRAAETDRGVASLLSVHPRNADGAIYSASRSYRLRTAEQIDS
jgi:hypothetical protein